MSSNSILLGPSDPLRESVINLATILQGRNYPNLNPEYFVVDTRNWNVKLSSVHEQPKTSHVSAKDFHEETGTGYNDEIYERIILAKSRGERQAFWKVPIAIHECDKKYVRRYWLDRGFEVSEVDRENIIFRW